MVQEVIWKTKALTSFNRILDFLLTVWNDEIADDFARLVHEKIELLKHYPETGILSAETGFRKTVIHPNVVLYYDFYPKENVLELHLFWDVRQNPEKLIF